MISIFSLGIFAISILEYANTKTVDNEQIINAFMDQNVKSSQFKKLIKDTPSNDINIGIDQLWSAITKNLFYNDVVNYDVLTRKTYKILDLIDKNACIKNIYIVCLKLLLEYAKRGEPVNGYPVRCHAKAIIKHLISIGFVVPEADIEKLNSFGIDVPNVEKY